MERGRVRKKANHSNNKKIRNATEHLKHLNPEKEPQN